MAVTNAVSSLSYSSSKFLLLSTKSLSSSSSNLCPLHGPVCYWCSICIKDYQDKTIIRYPPSSIIKEKLLVAIILLKVYRKENGCPTPFLLLAEKVLFCIIINPAVQTHLPWHFQFEGEQQEINFFLKLFCNILNSH